MSRSTSLVEGRVERHSGGREYGEVGEVLSVFFHLGYGDGVHMCVLVKLCTLNMCTLFYIHNIPVKPLKCYVSFYLTAVSL